MIASKAGRKPAEPSLAPDGRLRRPHGEAPKRWAAVGRRQSVQSMTPVLRKVRCPISGRISPLRSNGYRSTFNEQECSQ